MTTILYHANCNDGAGAAFAAWLKLGDMENDQPIDYIPVQYGNQPPEIEGGQRIYLLDFSYPRETIIELAKKAAHITIIDHHKTAQADLSTPFPREHDGDTLCPIDTTFNMEKSGAMLAWEHFHPGTKAPKLIEYIQDRDLWKFNLEDTKEFTKGLQLYPEWRHWTKYIGENGEQEIEQTIRDGLAINCYLDTQAHIITETPPTHWAIENQTVPVYNLPGFMMSDTLALALKKYPDTPYAVGFFYKDHQLIYSLRSRAGSDIDVSAIAKRHGGGGHKHAAGFTIKI